MSEVYNVIYDKLVRDKVPDNICSMGDSCETETLEDNAFRLELLRKLVEESSEAERCLRVKRDRPIELLDSLIDELADIEEILSAIKEEFQINPSEIAKARERKTDKQGAFKNRVFLKSATRKKILW